MNLRPFSTLGDYEYVRQPFNVPDGDSFKEGESVLAIQNGRMLGIESVRHLDIPLLPERLKPMLHEVRMRRAAKRAGQKAEKLKKTWERTWLMDAKNHA